MLQLCKYLERKTIIDNDSNFLKMLFVIIVKVTVPRIVVVNSEHTNHIYIIFHYK
jgi:hypothetical protein